jgi:hypothetical protein
VYTTVRVAIVVDLYKGNGGARPVRRFLRQDFVYPLPASASRTVTAHTARGHVARHDAHAHGTDHTVTHRLPNAQARTGSHSLNSGLTKPTCIHVNHPIWFTTRHL